MIAASDQERLAFHRRGELRGAADQLSSIASGRPIAAWLRRTASSAWPRETPGGRLKESATAGKFVLMRDDQRRYALIKLAQKRQAESAGPDCFAVLDDAWLDELVAGGWARLLSWR